MKTNTLVCLILPLFVSSIHGMPLSVEVGVSDAVITNLKTYPLDSYEVKQSHALPTTTESWSAAAEMTDRSHQIMAPYIRCIYSFTDAWQLGLRYTYFGFSRFSCG